MWDGAAWDAATWANKRFEMGPSTAAPRLAVEGRSIRGVGLTLAVRRSALKRPSRGCPVPDRPRFDVLAVAYRGHLSPHKHTHNENRMALPAYPVAVVADEAPLRTKASNYPEPFASQMAGRRKQPLGDLFGLTNFGVNLTRLAPGAVSSLRHAHTKQDEFVYILQGHPTLHTDAGRTRLSPGMCAGFKAGTGNGHRLINETEEEVIYLEVGDRTPGDEGSYPDDDLKAVMVGGKWKFVHKDGSAY